MQLLWSVDDSTSVMHAAEAIRRGLKLADARLEEALAGPVQALAADVRASGLPEARFWRNLTALAFELPGNRELAETVIRKSDGGSTYTATLTAVLAGRIADLESAAQRLYPRMREDLALRERPLREQWEARGPGLLKTLAGLTSPELLVEQARVILIHPAQGGGGDPHLQQNSVRIEAMLTNPHSQLPEVVRLAWLLAQLNCDLPMFSEMIHGDRLPYVTRLALLPPVLQAAAYVELTAEPSPELYTQAIEAWHIIVPPGVEAGSLLTQWWRIYQETRPSWAVALTALDRMLG